MASDEPRLRDRFNRSARLGRVAVSQLSRVAWRRLREPFMSEAGKVVARDREMLRLADDLVSALGSMKGAAMKFGQSISLLNLGLSSAEARAEFTKRLAPLYRQAPPTDNDIMFELLDRELGACRDQLVSIESEPIAAASLGQVYRGTLADGRTVAVKVQYPSAKSAVAADLRNLALLSRLRARDFPNLGLAELVAEIGDQIHLELDYERELDNHRQVYRAHVGHPAFRIPEPIENLCTAKVLTTEYLEGTTLDQLGPVSPETANTLGEALYRFYCGGLYTAGQFCADPHPGNIIALDDGTVGFVDFGLYVTMDTEQITLERAIFAAVLASDAPRVHALLRSGGFIVDESAMPEEVALGYLAAIGAWHLAPGVVTVTPESALLSVSEGMLPSSSFREWIYQQRVPREHLFSRRTEMNVCALLGDLQASAPWRAISEEWILNREPATDMGRRIAQWESR